MGLFPLQIHEPDSYNYGVYPSSSFSSTDYLVTGHFRGPKYLDDCYSEHTNMVRPSLVWLRVAFAQAGAEETRTLLILKRGH